MLNNIGDIYLSKGDYETARIFFSQSLQIREKLKFPTDIADTQHNLGDTFTGLGQYDQAIQQYLSALDLRRKASPTSGVLRSNRPASAFFTAIRDASGLR